MSWTTLLDRCSIPRETGTWSLSRMDYLEAPGSQASLSLEAYSDRDMSTIFRGPSGAGTNTSSQTPWPCEPAWMLCIPHTSMPRERCKEDTTAGPSWESSTISARERYRSLRLHDRSEERRVGRECGWRWGACEGEG